MMKFNDPESEWTFPYLKSEWNHQKEKIKQIFGHNDQYMPEQYVNTLIDMVLYPEKYNLCKDTKNLPK